MNRDLPACEGGIPVREGSKNPWPRWPIFDESEKQAINAVLQSGAWWYVEGSEGAAFEKEFAAFQNARHALLCTNGTAALEVALRALGIGCDDEVIVPSYTFAATATAVLAVGATPVFIDIDGATLNLDPTRIDAAVTPRTRAIIVVHIAGRPADMDGVLEAAAKHRLRVIEDAAQAHGAAWRGTRVGALGDIGTFSFQASKNLTAGEGGCIVTNSDEIADAAWSVINIGRIRQGGRYEHEVFGSNYRLGEFQSALLRTQIKRLPAQMARREANAEFLRSHLADIPGILLPAVDARITEHANHLFTFRRQADNFGGRDLEGFLHALEAEGIACWSGYSPLYKEKVFTAPRSPLTGACQAARPFDPTNLHLPVCEQVCKDTVWLPQWVLLANLPDMEDIVVAVRKLHIP